MRYVITESDLPIKRVQYIPKMAHPATIPLLPLPDEYIPPLPAIVSTSIKLKEYEGEKIEWEERETCFVSTAKQCGPLWKRLRLGAIVMSTISLVIDRVPVSWRISKGEAARIICGLSAKAFDETALQRMGIGITGEPIFRQWHSKQLDVPIREVGVAVWKKDPRFRGSIDGDLDDGTFAEYKIPEHMYRALIEYIEAAKKGFTRPPSDYSHIFDSHYDQMTGNGVIMGKHTCRYNVMSWGHPRMIYQQNIPINHEHWDTVLYPQALAFHEAHVEPLMAKYKFQRIDPDTPVKLYST